MSDGEATASNGRAPRLLANVGWMVVAEGVGKVASFFFVLVVARGLGLRSYGTFNFAMSFVPLFLLLASSGLNIAVVREVARDHGRLSAVMASAVVPRIALLAAAYAAALITAPFFVDRRTDVLVVAIVGLALLVDEMTGFLGAAFKALERMSAHATTLVVNRVLSTLLALVVLAGGGGLVAISVAYLAGSVGSLVAGVAVLRARFPRVSFADARRDLGRDLVRQGFVLGLASALNLAVFRIDAVLLQAISGAAAVGLYGVAYRFLDSTLFLAWSLSGASMPRIARLGAGREAGRLLGVTMAAAASFYLPFAVGAVFLASWAVELLFGTRFAGAADAVPWLAASGLFYATAFLIRNALIAIGWRGSLVFVAAGVLVFNVAANLVAIPEHGFVGAAAVTLATEVLETLVLGFLFVRATGRLPLDASIIIALGGSATLAVALAVTSTTGAVSLALGTVAFVVGAAVAAACLGRERVREAAASLR